MSIKHLELPIEDIILLDKNPRYISDNDFKKLCDDIEKDTSFLIQRPPLINELKGKYYCYAGTQRVKACKSLGHKSIKCFIEENVPERVQNERMLKDNLHRGIWDETKIMDLGFEIGELHDIGLNDIDFELLTEPTELTSPKKDEPFSLRIIFESEQQLNQFEIKLKDIMKIDQFKNLTYSVRGKEL